MGSRGPFPANTASGASGSPSYCAEVKNLCNYTSTSPHIFRGCGKRSHGSTPLPHISFSCYAFPSNFLAILFTRMLVVMTFANSKSFGVADIGRKGPEWDTSTSRKGEASSAVILTTHGTTFCDLNIIKHGKQLYNVRSYCGNSDRYCKLRLKQKK